MSDKPQFTAEEALASYIGLHKIVTGETLKELDVTPEIYTNYVQTTMHAANVHNLTQAFIDGKVMINGVLLNKKVQILK